MKALVRIMWVPVLISVLYTGWVFWQRHREQTPVQPAKVERDPLAAYGKTLKILQFYTSAAEIAPGSKALMCYGVVNATAVRLDPPVESVWPAVSRCFEVTPSKTTRYTLTAEGADHASVSESVEIVVKRKGA
jgi:hypothetical protein